MKPFFDLAGKTAVITGAGGVLCSAMAKALASAGAKVAVVDAAEAAAVKVAKQINKAGGRAVAVRCDVLDRACLTSASRQIIRKLGRIDILINGAGGNRKDASTSAQVSFFDLPVEAVRFVVDLNFLGTFLPCQVFGKDMARRRRGVILNISSMNALRPLTRICGYSAAKAAVTNFTRWLAVYMCQNFSPHIRVNAIAPGFFLTVQNRFLLTVPSGNLTDRGKTIIAHTPMARFGKPDDLLGTVLWLVSDAAKFVTGIVVPIDGGFSAFSGV